MAFAHLCQHRYSGTDGDLFGLVVISGTGTITYGVNREGAIARAAGCGYVVCETER
jgi:N-acetylglucosamine kinase-like BadF-type ATPase